MQMEELIQENLARVIDPETGLNVLRMGLIESMDVDESAGNVYLVFRPTSFFCPMAFKLAVDIQDAIKKVSGVASVKIEVRDFARANELNALLEDTSPVEQ